MMFSSAPVQHEPRRLHERQPTAAVAEETASDVGPSINAAVALEPKLGNTVPNRFALAYLVAGAGKLDAAHHQPRAQPQP